MKIAVIGKNGQLARSLAERATNHGLGNLVFAGRPEIDFEKPETIGPMVQQIQPDIIINAAAFTAVDRAEDEPQIAARVNAIAPGELARAARKAGARLLHISTDYVFDGARSGAYQEEARPNPQSVYGQTKLEGEIGIRAELADHLILRTAWVYSPFGENFLKTMLRLAETRSQLSIVADQTGNPTSALDLADAIFSIVERWQNGARAGLGKTYHCSGKGETSWAGFARHILVVSRSLDGPFAEIVDIKSADWPAKAKRPKNSRLDCSRLKRDFGIQLPAWQDSAAAIVSRLCDARTGRTGAPVE